jgi:hypothetical protein
MNPPEIIYRLDKFDFHVSLKAWHVPRANDSADDVPPVRVRKNHGLPHGQIVRISEDCAIVEHNDGPALFSNRLGRATRFIRQAPDGDYDLEAYRIGTRRLTGFVFGILIRRTRLPCAGHFGWVFDGRSHCIPIMNGPTHEGLRAPSECVHSRMGSRSLAIVRGYYKEIYEGKNHLPEGTGIEVRWKSRASDYPRMEISLKLRTTRPPEVNRPKLIWGRKRENRSTRSSWRRTVSVSGPERIL